MKRLREPFRILAVIIGTLSISVSIYIAFAVESTSPTYETGLAMITLFGYGIWCLIRGEVIEL